MHMHMSMSHTHTLWYLYERVLVLAVTTPVAPEAAAVMAGGVVCVVIRLIHMCVPRLIHMCAMTLLCVCHDLHAYVCEMTYVRV